ncbi:MAG: hypothetical protein HKP29_09200 [Silicimonas sp.]|nr:hypothetical protein [Silicimonas sp.]NNL73528.1 hypothetical protein [Silicimonas sp.]
MQRLVLAVVLVAVAAAAVGFVISRVARAFDGPDENRAVEARNPMQKISFFLLLCLILYVAMSGAS